MSSRLVNVDREIPLDVRPWVAPEVASVARFNLGGPASALVHAEDGGQLPTGSTGPRLQLELAPPHV